MKRRIGFYLAGEFRKGKMAKFILLPQNQKPFQIDNVEGTISPKGIRVFDKKRSVMFPDEWFFIENYKISQIDKDKCLRILINEIWKDWCKKHKRKYSEIMIENDSS